MTDKITNHTIKDVPKPLITKSRVLIAIGVIALTVFGSAFIAAVLALPPIGLIAIGSKAVYGLVGTMLLTGSVGVMAITGGGMIVPESSSGYEPPKVYEVSRKSSLDTVRNEQGIDEAINQAYESIKLDEPRGLSYQLLEEDGTKREIKYEQLKAIVDKKFPEKEDQLSLLKNLNQRGPQYISGLLMQMGFFPKFGEKNALFVIDPQNKKVYINIGMVLQSPKDMTVIPNSDLQGSAEIDLNHPNEARVTFSRSLSQV